MSAGAPALQLAPLPANAVRLLGYNDYRQMFMPLAREYIESLIAKGEYHPDVEREARLWAAHHAYDALNRPHHAAAAAVAFCARCIASWKGDAE